jgi:hypothetical protein
MADDEDPQVAEALALARVDPDLARWLEEHGARQLALRRQFRSIPVPAGLKEQIISEQRAHWRSRFRRPDLVLAAVAAAMAVMLALAVVWFRPSPTGNTFAIYRARMAGVALRGYVMDLKTSSPARIRDYLARNGAPADYALPAPLRKATLTGCAIESWQGAKVSMICFRTGRPLPPGQQSDLWLFVVRREAVGAVPALHKPQLAGVNRLSTAVWTEGGKVYLLGSTAGEQALRRFL